MPDKQNAARWRSLFTVLIIFYGSLTKVPLVYISEHIVFFKVKALA